jgi:hypothetical protein
MTAPVRALCYSGLTAISLALDGHHRQLWHRPPAPRTAALRVVGAALLSPVAIAAVPYLQRVLPLAS